MKNEKLKIRNGSSLDGIYPAGTKAVASFIAGRLMWKPVRDLLEDLKFRGHNIEWREGRGWLTREWTLKGNAADLIIIMKALEAWELPKL